MQSSINLDETDVKILCAVMNDVWAPASEIAKEVGVSRPTARRRLQKLFDIEIIRGFTAILVLFQFDVDVPSPVVECLKGFYKVHYCFDNMRSAYYN